MKWYLIINLYACHGGGIDPGIIQGNCTSREVRIEMPSLETCRLVRAVQMQFVNAKCLSEDLDK